MTPNTLENANNKPLYALEKPGVLFIKNGRHHLWRGEEFEPSTPNLGGPCFIHFPVLRQGRFFMQFLTSVMCNKHVRSVVCMSNVTVRVPEELKGRMKRCKSVNWSEVARKAFEDAAREQEMQHAAESIKNLRLESKSDWDGAKEIRKWRDAAR
jgi:hypothetical protein